MSTSSSSVVALPAGAATTDSGKQSTLFDFTDSSLEQVEGRSCTKTRADARRHPSQVRTQFTKQRDQKTSHTPKSRSLSAARQKDPSAASSFQPPADEAMPISALVKQTQQLPPSVPTTSSSGSTWHTLEEPA